MTFQELAIRLNYNRPSGAEQVYKSAICKLRKQLNGGAYSQWLSVQKAIQVARREAGREMGYHSPQSIWLDEQELIWGFLCKTAALRRVCHILYTANEEELEISASPSFVGFISLHDAYASSRHRKVAV